MSSIAEFLFSFHCNLKMYHWSTTRYARHKAADECIDRLLVLGDTLMEAYIGRYGRSFNKRESNIALTALDDKTAVAFLDNASKFLVVDLPRLFKKDDVDLLNIRDEMLATINTTKYLFSLQ